MRRLLPVCVAALLVLVGTAWADPPDGDQTQIKKVDPAKWVDRASAGLFLGVTNNGDSDRGGGSGGEAGVVFDVPIVAHKRVRVDATRTSWYSKEDDGRGNILAADTITLTTLRASLVSVLHQSSGVSTYHGVGVGGYRYDYARTPLTHHWFGGVHYIFGMEFLRNGGRSAINTEVRIHAMDGPTVRPETQVLMFKFDAVVGMKLRF